MNADQITGEKIHIIMRRRGMVQADIAPHLDIDQSSMSKKLYGKRSWTLDEILTVAKVLDVPVTELLPDADYEPNPSGRGRELVMTRARRDSNPQPSDWESVTARQIAGRFWTADRQHALIALECQLILDGGFTVAEWVQ